MLKNQLKKIQPGIRDAAQQGPNLFPIVGAAFWPNCRQFENFQ